jgi:putative transposase
MLTFGEYTMRAVCAELDVEMVSFDSQAHRAHYPPTLVISTLLQRLKGPIVYPVRREFTRARVRSHRSSSRYFAASCGGTPIHHQAIHRRPSTPTLNTGVNPATSGMT